MKKRILSCLMALALCLTLLPTAALAADGAQAADGTVHKGHCLCGATHNSAITNHGSNQNAFTDAKELKVENGTLMKDGKEWKTESIKVWSTGDTNETVYQLPAGTYYLGSNIEITEHPIMITGDVTLCLNGNQITCGSSAPACVIGVYTETTSTLTLTDCKTTGEITGGTSYGVDVRKGYTFNMHGGTITGGVAMSGNTEGSPTKFNMSGGTITGGGTGVRLTQYCTFTMSGGTISNNKGGVSTGGGEFTMSGGEISGNTATSNGGGVNIGNGGTFTMNAGAKITQNTAGYAGGGVYVSGGTFIMNGGEIKSNIAKTNGGGVFVTKVASSSNSAFTMNGGEIKSNTAETNGGGVFVDNGTFTVSGKPIVSENTSGSEGNKVTDNVYLLASKTITIGSGLTNGTDIGVTTGSVIAPTEDSTIAITTATKNARGYLSYFKSDNDSYEIVANSEQTQLVLKAKPKIDLTNSAVITLMSKSADLVYTGKPITVAYEVKYNDKMLKLGEDYTVTGGSGTDATDYTLKITGTGQYTGKVEKKWTITPLTVNVSSVTLREKEYDGTCNGSHSDVTSVKFTKGSSDSEIVTLQSGDYTIESVTYADANAGIQNADIIIKLAENGNYTFAGSNKLTAQFGTRGKITKASADNLTAQTGEINVVNNKADSYTLDLNTLLPTPSKGNLGNIENYTLDTVNLANGYYESSDPATINGSKLTLPIKAANSVNDGNQIGTVKVKVTTQNYTDITLTINVKATNKIVPTGVPTLSANELTYGQALSAIKLSGTMKDDGKIVPGTFAWVNGTVKPEVGSGTYEAAWKFTPADGGTYAETTGTVSITVNKAQLSGTPTFTKVTEAGKTLNDVTLTEPKDWPKGTFEWGSGGATETSKDTQIVQGQAYSWYYKSANHFATGQIVPWANPSSGSGSSSGGYDSSDSNPIIKTETKNNPDGSTTKTETRKDGSVTQTTTGKDGSVSKTETKKDGSSVTENKAADGSTGTVKTDKNGQTTAETTLSSKAIEDAKKNGEAVKAPVQVEATRDSNTAPTVKIELPRNSGDTKVEIPVTNIKPGTVAVLVHADGTEEIVKNSLPTADGIQLTVNGGATVKIVDNSKDFIDTQDHWAKDAIDFVSARGLVNGMNAVSYAPNASTTRAQLWTILARQNDADLTGGTTWFENAQNWAKEKGISDGTNPNGTINRAQMVTMLWRAMGQPAAVSGASFADVPADSYYAQAVAWAVENGITTGVGGGRFDPNATCTRAQIATFLYRYMK